MSQSLPIALFLGPKDAVVAQKVINFVVWYGFITSIIGFSIWFIPYEPLQQGLDQLGMPIWLLSITLLISLLCYYFLYKKQLWAPCVLVVLNISDMIMTYMDSGTFPGSIAVFTLAFFMSATQATFLLKKQQREDDSARLDPSL
jgi:uncharacterized membrane protein